MKVLGWGKPDAYVITVSEKDVGLFFGKLIRTNYWNPRAKFAIIYEGNVTKLMEALHKNYVLNVLVLLKVAPSEIDIFTYYPYTTTHLGSGK